jgi:hypothetical protein
MKHVYMKYVWNNCWQYPEKEGIWHREKEDKIRKGQKKPDVLISMCTLGDYVLNLSLFSTFLWKGKTLEEQDKEMDRVLTTKHARFPPSIYGYSFSVNTRKGETLFYCELSVGLWFDTRDIDEAEKAAEYIWNCMEFKKGS